MTVANPIAISVAGLEKHYGPKRAVDGLSFDVARGEIFALLGPNGAGKTTTVEILEGYRTPDAGTVRVLGLDPVADGEQLRGQIGVMLQEGGMYPGLRPLEVLRLFAAMYPNPLEPHELLEKVGLVETRTTVRRLSGGQQQRLALCASLIGRPELVFLDEPTAGMDPQARALTWELIRELRSQGVTIVLTTHLLDEVEALCDRVAIIASGSLAAIGSPRELMSRSVANDVLFTTAVDFDVVALAADLGLMPHEVVFGGDGRYEVRAAGTPKLIARLTSFLERHDIELGTLQANARSLEAVFLQITAEAESESAAQRRTIVPAEGNARRDRAARRRRSRV